MTLVAMIINLNGYATIRAGLVNFLNPKQLCYKFKRLQPSICSVQFVILRSESVTCIK